MVSPIPSLPSSTSAVPATCPPTSTPAAHAVPDPLQAEHTPYVEQHFPHQMSWYAPEGPQGATESVARWVRENPWPALGIAAAAGFFLALLSGPAARSTAAGARAIFRDRSSDECVYAD